MSLLLDALKKAADDKQKASQSSTTNSAPTNEDSIKEVIESTEELSLQATDEKNVTNALSAQSSEQVEELTLEADEVDINEPGKEDLNASELTLEEVVSESASGLANSSKGKEEANKSSPAHNKEYSAAKAAGYAVSDDALSMLINKTNRDVKREKSVLLISVFLVSLVILIAGGVYYYQDMQTEIAALERKYQIAMQSMRSKTNREKTPEKSEVIRSLVSESGPNEKVQFAKKYIANEKSTPQVRHESKRQTGASTRTIKTQGPTLSIQKTNKSDPVGEKIDLAWLAYESGQYDEAKKLYKQVLNVEESNRDALLGMGAIAVNEKDNSMAREVYLALLKQDPRDPIATAALAGLHGDASMLKSDEEYMLSMLQKNSDAPHLNFAMGNIYAQQKKWKSAQQYYFNAWQHDNENADYIFNLAVSMDQLNKQQQAINFYKDSLLKAANKQVSFSREAVQKRIQELSGL